MRALSGEKSFFHRYSPLNLHYFCQNLDPGRYLGYYHEDSIETQNNDFCLISNKTMVSTFVSHFCSVASGGLKNIIKIVNEVNEKALTKLL